MIDTGLAGKVVLVTGANHGLGAATATAFAAQEARVYVTFLGPPSPDKVIGAIRSSGGHLDAWEADLSDVAVIPRLFDRVEAAFGPVEVLVNNAAWARPDTFAPVGPEARAERGDRPVHAITPELVDRHHAVNARAPALLMAEFARRHIARGARWGRIINVSTGGASGFRGEVSYGARKHAMESYNSAAAEELGPYGYGQRCRPWSNEYRLDHVAVDLRRRRRCHATLVLTFCPQGGHGQRPSRNQRPVCAGC